MQAGPAVARAQRLSADDWKLAARAMLAENGVDALRIEALARRLDVTKGSFYWHFRDRDALLADLLADWQRNTVSVIEGLDAREGAPAARLARLLAFCMEEHEYAPGGRLEMALRDWARSDGAVAAAVAEIDLRRMSYLTDQYAALGLDRAEASDLAYAFMAFVTGCLLVGGRPGRAAQMRRRRQAIAMLVTPFAPSGVPVPA